MLKENPRDKNQDELFRSRLDQIIDMRHPLAGHSRRFKTTSINTIRGGLDCLYRIEHQLRDKLVRLMRTNDMVGLLPSLG